MFLDKVQSLHPAIQGHVVQRAGKQRGDCTLPRMLIIPMTAKNLDLEYGNIRVMLRGFPK